MFKSIFCNAFLVVAGLAFVFPSILQRPEQTVAYSDHEESSHNHDPHDHQVNRHEHQHRHSPDEPLHTHEHQHEFHGTPDVKIAYLPIVNIVDPEDTAQEFNPHVDKTFESKVFNRIFRPPMSS